jgi:hypothetical protein
MQSWGSLLCFSDLDIFLLFPCTLLVIFCYLMGFWNGCRGAPPWGDRPVPRAPNAWGSSSLLSLKNGEGSGSFFNINDRPSSPGSSSTSTDESDLLDSPVACGLTSHDSVTAISHPQNTELRSGSWRFAHSQISFSDVLKAPLRTIAKKVCIPFGIHLVR